MSSVRETAINGATPVALGLVIAVIGAVGAMYASLSSIDQDIQARLSQGCERIAALEKLSETRDKELARIYDTLKRIEDKVDSLRQ